MADLKIVLSAVTLGCLAYLLRYYLTPPGPSVVDHVQPGYDYVIVGGGAAGCVLAARLSEDEDVTVLLLEAGGEETNNPDINIPFAAFGLWATDAATREYSTRQRNASLGLKGNRESLIRAHVLGGGSSINCMFYLRGNREDYDGWAKMGCDGWSYKDVLPYFIKSENIQIPELKDSEYHGSAGPLFVEKVQGITLLGQAMVDAATELGYDETDFNGNSQEGGHLGQVNVHKGERWSAASAFLRPAMGRKNLHVATRSFVTRVLFNNKEAFGVKYIRNDQTDTVHARKEVILSAGAIASPKLLLLSGVGPKEDLKDLKIPLIADLPVGKNQQDHVQIEAIGGLLKEGAAISPSRATSWWENVKYKLLGTGVPSIPCGAEGVLHMRAPSQSPDKRTPFLHFTGIPSFFGANPDAAPFLKNIFNYQEKVFDELFLGEETAGKDGFSFLMANLRPFSRGTLRLSSTDPYDPPQIDTNILDDKRDVNILLDGVRMGQKIVNTKAFREIGYKDLKRVHPGCKQHQYDSDAYWECYIRHNSCLFFHTSGTCKMGAADDMSAVVDPQLRVRGVRGIRVVDASVMPTIVAAHTYAPTVMIAEKAADMIRRRQPLKPIDI